jgi:hypothetical protein
VISIFRIVLRLGMACSDRVQIFHIVAAREVLACNYTFATGNSTVACKTEAEVDGAVEVSEQT